MLSVAIAMFIVGLILLIWPRATIAVAAILIGIALLVTGVLRLIQALSSEEESGGKRVAYVIIGILAVLAGLYCLRHLAVTATILAVVVGLFWAVHGIADLVVAAGPGVREDRGLIALTGVLSLIAGLIVIFWSPISLAVLVAVIGVWLILDAVLLTLLAFKLRREAQAGGHAGLT